jgi:hypothetical protein
MTTACLVLVAALTAVAALVLAQSVHRRDDFRALVGMTVLLAATLPAAVYGALTS